MSWFKPKPKLDPEEERLHELTIDPVPNGFPPPKSSGSKSGKSGTTGGGKAATGLPLPAVCRKEIDIWKESVRKGSAASWITPPPAKIIAIAPPKELEDDQPALIAQLKEYKELLQNYAWAKAFEIVHRDHPQLYSSEDPADMAKCSGHLARQLFLVYQRSLGAVLPATMVAERSFEKKVTSVEIHSTLLEAMFGGYQLSSDNIAELDNFLKQFVVTLKDSYDYLVVSRKAEASTAAVTIVTNSFVALQPKDSDGALIPMADLDIDMRIWELNIRCYYFELDLKSTVTTVNLLKTAKDKKYKCKMDWLDFKGTINTTVMADYVDWFKMTQEQISPEVVTYLKETATINQKKLRSSKEVTPDNLAGMFAGATYLDLTKVADPSKPDPSKPDPSNTDTGLTDPTKTDPSKTDAGKAHAGQGSATDEAIKQDEGSSKADGSKADDSAKAATGKADVGSSDKGSSKTTADKGSIT